MVHIRRLFLWLRPLQQGSGVAAFRFHILQLHFPFFPQISVESADCTPPCAVLYYGSKFPSQAAKEMPFYDVKHPQH